MEGSEEAAAARWRQCGRLVHAVRAGTQEKKFYDDSVKALRAQLRAEFEALLLDDYSYAQVCGTIRTFCARDSAQLYESEKTIPMQVKDAEQMLWKTVFYTVIEEFRRRIKAAIAQGQKGSEPLRKTTAVFVRFLREASTFYALLISKLQAAYGRLGFTLEFPGLDDLDAVSEQTAMPEFKTSLDCRISIYRCLICLGDLARYEEMAVKDAGSKDWSRAEQYYYQAVDVFPEGGNSFNQLAVLATYSEAHLQAVCHYFRSLAVAHPFQVARENLLLLFDQARAKYESLPASQAAGTPPVKGRGRGGKAAAQKPRVPIAQLLPMMAIRFAHAHGVLFCKINLDSFNDILQIAFADLDDLVGRAPVARGSNGEARRSDAMLMQLTIMSLFAAWNADYCPPGRLTGYSETLQTAEVKKHVWTLTFGLAARLAYAAACVGDISMLHAGAPLTSPLLAPLNVLLQWMATQRDIFRCEDMGSAEAKERAAFWGALCKLLLLMPSPAEAPAAAALPEDWQLRAFGPLNTAHQRLEFQLPRAEKDDGELRLQRILQSLKGIADWLPNERSQQPWQSLSPPRQEEQAAASGFQRAVLRMFGSSNQAPQAGAVPAAEHGDAQMHEAAASDAEARQASDAPPILAEQQAAAMPPLGNGQPSGGGGQTDADDDMEDDERIVYTPAQSTLRPPGTDLEGSSAYSPPPAATEAHAEMPGRAPQQAPQAQEKQIDILDQLMQDGAVQGPQLGTANGLPATTWAGTLRGEGTFSPMSVYGAEQTVPKPAMPLMQAAAPADNAGQETMNRTQLPRDLSDADLGLLEIPEADNEPAAPQNEGMKQLQSSQILPEQQSQPQHVAAASGMGLRALPTGLPTPADHASHLQGLQQSSTGQQPRQQKPRLYSGPGTVAPPPSALPQPSFAHGPASYSSILGSQQATGLPQPPISYNDVLAEQGGARTNLAGFSHPAAQAKGSAAVAPGQGAAQDAQQQQQQQQPSMWLSAAGMPNQIATPDNAAGLGTWQAITDSHHGGTSIQTNAAATAEAAGSATFPGHEAKTGVSFMREGDTAAGAGGFLGRDLFANQRSELSRHASPASMWEAPGSIPAGAPVGNANAPYGVGTVPAMYGGAEGGFYINRDKQPQVPAAPKQGGFYQRDSRDLEAQLLAQALAARTGQPASSQPWTGAAPLQLSTVASRGTGASGADSQMQGSRAQSPAAVSEAEAAPVPGLWAAAGPPPSVLGSSAARLPGVAGVPQIPGVPQTSMLGSELPQLPLWPNMPGQAMLGGQLGQQQAYSLFPGSLNTSLALSMGMPGLGVPALGPIGQGAFSHAGSYGQFGASNGGGYHSGYGMQNGAVHLGSGQPTADQGFAGLSNAQLQQRLALLQQSGGLGMGAPPLQALSAPGQQGQQTAQAKPGSGTFSWLDAFQARQEALKAQAAAPAPSAFPFPGATADASLRLGNPNEPWRAH